jgi:hypothetical protein
MVGKRYSVPILGKYLVIIANPDQQPTHTQFFVLPNPHRTYPTIMSVQVELTGGYFSA